VKARVTLIILGTILGWILVQYLPWFDNSRESNPWSIERKESEQFTAEQKRYLRVELLPGTEAPQIVSTALIDTNIIPTPSPDGYIIALVDGETTKSASLFNFSHQVTLEFESSDGKFFSNTKDLSSSAIAYLPWIADFDVVQLYSPQGVLLASYPRSDLEDKFTSDLNEKSAKLPLELPSAFASSPSLSDLQSAFPHIDFVTSPDSLPSYFANGSFSYPIEKIDPLTDPYWINSLYTALNNLSSVQLSAIARIGVLHLEGSGVATGQSCDGQTNTGILRGITYGNQIMLNADSLSPELQPIPTPPSQIASTLAHESIHAYHNLLDRVQVGIDRQKLPPSLEQQIKRIREKLHTGLLALTTTWQQLQFSANKVHSQYAAQYNKTDYNCVYPDQLAAISAGFAEPYGAKSAKEDIATYVQIFYTPNAPPSTHPICQALSSVQPGEIPKKDLLSFAKLNFLRALEFIDTNAYLSCVGQADPAIANDFVIANNSFSNGFKVGPMPGAPGNAFGVLGQSSKYNALLQIQMPSGSTNSIGFYNLHRTHGFMTLLTPGGYTGRNLLAIQKINPKGTIDRNRWSRLSSGGFAIITDDAPDMRKGYAFFVPLKDGLGRQSDFIDLAWFRLQ